MRFSKLNREVHRWGSLITALPVIIMIVTGILLQLKKDVAWVQPPTQSGSGAPPTLTFHEILEISRSVHRAEIQSWDDVDRLDARPAKGIVKVRARNRWEIQIDTSSGEVLQVSYRRSDLIESLHDGSFFHDSVKLWVFLPTAVILALLWVTGIYLFVLPYWIKRKRDSRVMPDSHFMRQGDS
jgi:uncharacterized iron-regulated membrane protein